MRKKNINLIGSSLYAIFIVLELLKKKKYNINIYEKSNNFLNSFSGIKINNYVCNPGFHAFESIRSDKLIKDLKKNFKISFKKINKSRGLILDDYIIDSREKYENWPNKILNKFNLVENQKIINPKHVLKKVNKKYIKFIHQNLGPNLEMENTLQLIYPWFFPNNYLLKSNDEGSVHLNAVRKKKIEHSYLVPNGSLFEKLKNPILKKLKAKGVKIHLGKNITFDKKKNITVYCDNKKLEGKSVVTLPIFTILSSLKNYKFKTPKIKSYKYFTALLQTNKRNILDDYLEIIVSSKKLKSLRRISNYSFVKKNKFGIYQLEFIEDSQFKNIDLQIQFYIKGINSILKLNTKKKNKVTFKLIGYKFVRYIFSPKNRFLKNILQKVDYFFKNENNIIIPRYITWPINTNKQYLFSKVDISKIKKKI